MQKSALTDLTESLYFYNPWWETGSVPPYLAQQYHRPVVKNIISYLSLDRVIILKGPRRTGKTTIFYQIIDNLIKSGVSGRDILFISFDDIRLRVDLDEVLKAYELIRKQEIKGASLIYVFMDEVHFLENWQFSVKKYFDRKYPIKFLISGSAASLIKKGSESLTGRTIDEIIFPFSFYEFLSLQSKSHRMMEVIANLREGFRYFEPIDTIDLTPYLTEIKMKFEEYIEKGGFPNLFSIKEPLLWKRLVREDIVEKVIYRDMVELYDIKKPEALEKLFLYLTGITSEILSVTNIANSLGLSREYTEKYLYYLEQSLLIKRLRKYARSIEKSIRSLEKLHILDSGLINAFSRIDIGKIIETIIVSHLIRLKGTEVFYFREGYEVDVIIELDKKVYPIEIKYKDDISKKELRGIEGFCKKFKSDRAIIVSRDTLKEGHINGCNVLFIPAWLFTLLVG
ncbi:MAG: ATP-binding protein [bacterium]